MARLLRLLTVSVAVLGALAWWSWPEPMPEPPIEEPLVHPVHHGSPPDPFAIDAPPPQLIHEAATRADGLDRVDPCAPTDPGVTSIAPPSLDRYAERRGEELDDLLRVEAERALGARLRGALGSAPVAARAELDASTPALSFAMAASLAAGARRAHRPDAMLRYARRAIDLAPDDALGFVLAHIAAEILGDDATARAALVRAFPLAPHEPDIAGTALWELGPSSDVMGALAAADAYLDVDPAPWIASIRAHLAARAFVFAAGVRRSRGSITVVGSAGLDDARVEHVLDVVHRARARVDTALGAMRGELVVYVYPDDEAMRIGSCGLGAGWTGLRESVSMTRAQLDAADGDDALYAAALRVVVAGVSIVLPRWIEGGIVEHLLGPETDADRAGYRTLVRRRHWLSVPGSLQSVSGDDPDARLARAQARAIVEWLVERRGEDVLRELATSGRRLTSDPILVLGEIAGAPLDEATLLAFLATRAR